MESRGRDSVGSYSAGITGGLFPRPSPARPRPSSDGVEGGIGLSRVLASGAVLGFVLGPPEALEVLAIRGQRDAYTGETTAWKKKEKQIELGWREEP
jgi:hypothetical protein